MQKYVFVPADVARRLKAGILVGFLVENAIVIILAEVNPPLLPDGMQILGTILDGSAKSEIGENHKPGREASSESNSMLLSLRFCPHHKRLRENSSANTYIFVEFAPPNPANLEFFSVQPVLLRISSEKSALSLGKAFYGPEPVLVLSNDIVLERINQCQHFRSLLARLRRKSGVEYRSLNETIDRDSSNRRSRPKLTSKSSFSLLFVSDSSISTSNVGLFERMFSRACASARRALNTPIRGTSAVDVSAWCRQLDMRLRQLAHLPTQRRLAAPSSTQPRPANAHYIRMHNTLWLMANDILCGITLVRLYLRFLGPIDAMALRTLDALLFEHLEVLIAWIGSHNPAGFKLNPALGGFMQSMCIWTLRAWRSTANAFAPAALCIFHRAVRLLGPLGVSFLAAGAADATRLVLVHVHFMNVVTTHVYLRQLQAVRSLWQLFRGRKINVLRKRVDALDDSWSIERLLAGTVLFTMLVYLLPTTVAFYVLFAGMRIAVLTACKMGDKVAVLFTLYPIFVVLLRLKNSRRLPGGVCFVRRGACGTSTWLEMQNRPVALDAVMRDFVRVFHQEGRLVHLARSLAEGRALQVQRTTAMKARYLDLPQEDQDERIDGK